MALQKTIETEGGVGLGYWRITRINENFDGTVEVYLGGYVSSEARAAGKAPVEYRSMVVDLRDATRPDVYEAVKASKMEARATGESDEEGNPITEEVETNVFADAVDC